MNPRDEQTVRSERAAEKAAATSALPRLVTHREQLELEGGTLARRERNHWARLAAVGLGAVLAVAYALWSGTEKSTPVLAWVVAGAFGVATAVLAVRWERATASRRRELEDLSAKMKHVGRRIDSAERTMRR